MVLSAGYFHFRHRQVSQIAERKDFHEQIHSYDIYIHGYNLAYHNKCQNDRSLAHTIHITALLASFLQTPMFMIWQKPVKDSTNKSTIRTSLQRLSDLCQLSGSSWKTWLRREHYSALSSSHWCRYSALTRESQSNIETTPEKSIQYQRRAAWVTLEADHIGHVLFLWLF